MKKKNSKVSRGYRLKESTHELIKKLIFITQENSDSVIARSCELFYREISGGNFYQRRNDTKNN